MEHRRGLRRFRISLDELLEAFAVVEALPARRADDPALREAIGEARPAIARLLAGLDRMERPDDEGQGAGREQGTP